MNTKELLEYVTNLRARVVSQDHESGVTKWALSVAILYLLSLALPNIAKLKYYEIPFDAFILIFTHAIGFLIGCSWLYSNLKGESKFSKFDYRLFWRTKSTTVRRVMGFYLLEGVYFLGLLISILNSSSFIVGKDTGYIQVIDLKISSIEWSFLAINTVIFGLIVLFITFYFIEIIHENSDGNSYPSKNTLKTKNENFSFFNWAFTFFLLLSNLHYVFYPTIPVSVETYNSLISLSFQISLSFCGVAYLLKSFNTTRTLDLLNKLERDIVIHGLSEVEIKQRLQDEYYGNEFQSWVLERISLIKMHVADFEGLLNIKNQFVEEVCSLDTNLKFERNGRVEEYKNKVVSALEIINQESAKLETCLKNFLPSVKSDIFLTGFINEKLVENKDIYQSSILNIDNLYKDLEKLESLNIYLIA